MKLYLTRDKDKALTLSTRKLNKQLFHELWDLPGSKLYSSINLPDSWFKDVKWSDSEPRKVNLMLPSSNNVGKLTVEVEVRLNRGWFGDCPKCGNDAVLIKDNYCSNCGIKIKHSG